MPMSSRPPSFLSSASLVFVAAALGFAAGRLTNRSGSAAAPGHKATTDTAMPTPSSSGPTAGPAGNARGRADPAMSAEQRWSKWSQATRSAATDRELSAAIEDLAKQAPERALHLAAQEPNLRSRELLREAALRGWASVAPDAALGAAMKLPGLDNRAAIAAVLQGAADDPNAVIRLGRQITDGSDPVAVDYGILAISALAEHGYFETAARFAAETPGTNQARWLYEAFDAWAREQPSQALAAVDRIGDAAMRHEAVQGLVAGWAESDPASLADHALREPPGEDRTSALGTTLSNWVLREPAAASRWLAQRDPDPSLDGGLAAVAQMPALISQRPEVATEWAEAISDSQTRQATLRTILEEWRRRSPGSLQQFLQTNSRLSDSDRNTLNGQP